METYSSHKMAGNEVTSIIEYKCNSGYGAMANVYFCLFDLRLAESITLAGQLSVRLAEQISNDGLNHMLDTNDKNYVIYSDSDSNYLALNDIVESCGMADAPTNDIVDFLDKFYVDKISPLINNGYDDLAEYTCAYDNKMNMDREGIANTAVFVSKKRYTMSVLDSEGVRFNEPYIKTMGLDLVKSSTPEPCKVAMKEVVRMLLNSTEDEIHKYVIDFKKEYFTLPPEDIARVAGTNKMEETYCSPDGSFINNVTIPINSRAAINYNNELSRLGLDNYEVVNNADKIKYVFLEEPNRLQTHVMGFVTVLPKEFNLHHKIDYKQLFFKTFVKPMEGILGLIGYELEPTPTLDGMFK